jgi:hypothetical protein
MSGPSLVEDIFLAALEKGTPEERAAFLNAACKDDADLRRRVERLLQAHPRAGGFLEGPSGEETAAYVPTGEQVGTVIVGRYKLLEQIGEGGMGTVWVAEQTQPIRRKVALKLIKAGMDSKTVLSRFEAERQALALMDHPNIAKVLDGGTTEGGRPFFVMEYVKGVPFVRYCDDARLSVAQRLTLFVPVCQAVQHAHQKGIIHRDLKPSNILVCLYDGQPVPKVIDFGLAKAMHQALTEHTLHTAHGVMMGTPLYMSPEQAEFNNLDVDTRTDIYALGVILYELLTGTTPLEKQRFQEAAWHEMLRVIKEEEPPRPSARLSGSVSLPALAAQRQLEPVKLTRLVRGELDWIVMKCLEKDRGRRYDTANGLARDVERYLADELVEARPPTAGYRLRKFARKHRVALATVAAFAGLLFASVAVSSWLAVKARRAEAAAQENRKDAEENAMRAEHNAGVAAGTLMGANYMRIKAEQTALSLQVDIDLTELRQDHRIGLLRLCRSRKEIAERLEQFKELNTIPPADELVQSTQDLRAFVTAAVTAAGQDYAPLLPPITHDGQAVTFVSLSPDNQTLLTLGTDSTARLWDTRTARQIAVLRKGDERVVNCGFSPDGRTVFTDDQTSVARFWDVPGGRFRAATEGRPNRYDVPNQFHLGEYYTHNVAQLGESRLLTRRFVAKETRAASGGMGFKEFWEGPVELWDTATGGCIARLDKPTYSIGHLKFMGAGRWVTCAAGGSTWVVYSAQDGREVARLKDDGPIGWLNESSSGKPVTITTAAGRYRFNVWDTQTWIIMSRIDVPSAGAADGTETIFDDAVVKVISGKAHVCRPGRADPIVIPMPDEGRLPFEESFPIKRNGEQFHMGDGRLFDSRTWKQLRAPGGRKYHPGLMRFSLDGRFVRAVVNGGRALIDTRTNKSFPTQGDWANLPKFGMVQTTTANDEATIRLIPSGPLLDLPADLLELWAQVAVQGELDAEGRFVKWDEPTWEKKRQELAAKPAPYSHFPFPGHVATDKLHWLRQEYESASDADKPRLAKQLLDRAEAAGDKAEAVRWRAILTPKSAPTKPAAKP